MICLGVLRKGNHLENHEKYGTIILKCIFKKWGWEASLD